MHKASIRKSEAPRAPVRGIFGKARRNSAEANPTSPCGLRRGRLSPFFRAKALAKIDPPRASARAIPYKAGKPGEGE